MSNGHLSGSPMVNMMKTLELDIAARPEQTGDELITDDVTTMTSALVEAYGALTMLRPQPYEQKYTAWQRAVRIAEDALRIHPSERYTTVLED